MKARKPSTILMALILSFAMSFGMPLTALAEEAPENLEIAKTAILSKLRTQRTIGQSVLYSYLSAKELGLDEPLDKLIFERVGDLTMDDLRATHAKWIKDRVYHYAILGDAGDMDMTFLRTLGPVKEVSLEEIFGY